MDVIVKGRTQFNKKALKGANLEQLIKDHKRTTSEADCIAAWEEVNGKYKPVEKEKPSKKKKEGE